MKHNVILLSVLTVMVFYATDVQAVQPQQAPATVEEEARTGENEAVSDSELQQLSKKQKREARKAERKHKKMERKRQLLAKVLHKIHMKASRGDTSGIGLALAIILAGAVLAILGLVGIADLLITIGIVVLAVGLIIWLFTALA